MVATSQSLEVEDAVAFDDSVAAIRRHLDDGASDENVFEVSNRGGMCLGGWWGAKRKSYICRLIKSSSIHPFSFGKAHVSSL